MCIAKWKLRNCIRILFLDLYNNEQKYLSQEQQAGLYPTVIGLLKDRASDWPATYATERFRARGHNGQFTFGTKVLPDWTIPHFADQLCKNLANNGVPWGKNIAFLHEICGIRNSTYHPLDWRNAEAALERVFLENCIPLEDLNQQQWYVDVGLEASSSVHRCLAWRTDSHSHLIQELAGIEHEKADKMTKFNHKDYLRDPASHLMGVSGFRLTPGRESRGEYSTRYINVYHTDKGVTSRQDQGYYGKFITVPDILYNKAAGFIDQLYEVYTTAVAHNYSCARFELRVTLEHANAAMVHFSQVVLRQSLVSFSQDEWW